MENCKVTCFNDVKIVPNRWFGITGDNGMCITFQEGHLIEAIRALINVEIVECPNELVARNLVYRLCQQFCVSEKINGRIQQKGH